MFLFTANSEEERLVFFLSVVFVQKVSLASFWLLNLIYKFQVSKRKHKFTAERIRNTYVCSGFPCTIMKLIGRFRPNRRSCLFRGLLAITGVSRIVWKIGGNLLSRRDFSNKLSVPSNFIATLHFLSLNLVFLNLSWFFNVLFETFGRTR